MSRLLGEPSTDWGSICFVVILAVFVAFAASIFIESERYLASGRQCIAAYNRHASSAEVRLVCTPLQPRQLWWQKLFGVQP